MGEDGVRCGNCGAVNDAAAQFCRACGVLLAAYQSPTGARPTDAADQPTVAMPDAADAPPAAPVEEMPEPSERAAEEPPAAHSVDDIFGRMPDADELVEAAVPTAEGTAPPEAATTVRDVEPVEVEPREVIEPFPAPASSAPSDAGSRPDNAVVEPVAVEQPPTFGRARPASRPAPPASRAGWNQIEPRQPLFGASGQRAATTPPQTWIVIGGALILASCVLGPTATAIDLPLIFAGPMWCAFPAGVILLVIGVIQLASRRPNRF